MVRPSRELELFHFSTVSVTHLWKNKLIDNSADFVLLIFFYDYKRRGWGGGFNCKVFSLKKRKWERLGCPIYSCKLGGSSKVGAETNLCWMLNVVIFFWPKHIRKPKRKNLSFTNFLLGWDGDQILFWNKIQLRYGWYGCNNVRFWHQNCCFLQVGPKQPKHAHQIYKK